MVRAASLMLLALALSGCERADLEDAVRRELRDPESARFSQVKRCGQSGVWHGLVNGKNGFGGYAGDIVFMYKDGLAWLATGIDRDGYDVLAAECHAAIDAQLAKTEEWLRKAEQSTPSPTR